MKQPHELKPPEVRPIKDLPDDIKAAIASFWQSHGLEPSEHTVVTFHDAIYTSRPMAQDLFVHECVHYARQGGGQDIELARQYVDLYLTNDDFRLQEELMAYREQYKFLLKHMNRPQAFEHVKVLAAHLSSPLYGNIISFGQALSAIMKA